MLLLVYAGVLLLAVLISDRAHRTVLSTTVLFLLAGIALAIVRGPQSPHSVERLAEIALVAVLFTDGMHACLGELRRAWRLPGRALLLGFPLTLAGNALAARLLTGLEWPEALLVGTALAPTDPVLASAIVGSEEVPARLRELLNVESGVNDGLALPFLVAFLAWAGQGHVGAGTVAAELAGGVALGIVLPIVAVRLERSRAFGASDAYRPIGVLSIGILTFALAEASGANAFLASFAAGATLATIAPRAPVVLAHTGEILVELLKLAAVLVFGTLLSPGLLASVRPGGWAFAVVALFVVRPVALALALVASGLPLRERVVAVWFGPKGFSSVVFGLLIAASGVPDAEAAFRIVAVTAALSILLHSSSDVPVVRWLVRPERPATA